jgi:hypothetical protein
MEPVMYELLHFTPGGAAAGRSLKSADLEEAILQARALIIGDDSMSVVEVRDDGETVFAAPQCVGVALDGQCGPLLSHGLPSQGQRRI